MYDNGDAGGAKDIIEDYWSPFNELCNPFENTKKSRREIVFLSKIVSFEFMLIKD